MIASSLLIQGRPVIQRVASSAAGLSRSHRHGAKVSWESHVQHHGILQEIWPGTLFVLEARACNPREPVRSMMIYKREGGQLIIYNGIAVDEKTLQEILALGTPKVLVVPHYANACCTTVWQERFPDLTVVHPDVSHHHGKVFCDQVSNQVSKSFKDSEASSIEKEIFTAPPSRLNSEDEGDTIEVKGAVIDPGGITAPPSRGKMTGNSDAKIVDISETKTLDISDAKNVDISDGLSVLTPFTIYQDSVVNSMMTQDRLLDLPSASESPKAIPRLIRTPSILNIPVPSLTTTSQGSLNSQLTQKQGSKRLAPDNRVTLLNPDGVRIMVIDLHIEGLRQLIENLGAIVIDSLHEARFATHVIAGDNNHSLRRTPKLMVALSCTSNILHMDWLRQSILEDKIMSARKYLVLKDSVAEKKYKFSMKETILEGTRRRKEGGLLCKWVVLFAGGVAGNGAPKREELELIVEAAGGKAIFQSDLPIRKEDDKTRVIVITSDPRSNAQTKNKDLQRITAEGAGSFTTTWLFDCITRQKLEGIKGEAPRKPERVGSTRRLGNLSNGT